MIPAFFSKGSRCTVQDAKLGHAGYTLWIEPNEPDGTTFSYHICFEHRHHPKGSLVRVKDWMDENFGADERKALQEDFRAMHILAPCCTEQKRAGWMMSRFSKKLCFIAIYISVWTNPFCLSSSGNNRILIADLKRMIYAETKAMRSGSGGFPCTYMTLADCCTFSEVAVGGTPPATENYRAFLKKLHPKQILNMQITIPLYRVRYSYMTRRGNIRQSEKFFFATAGEHEELALEVEMKLKDWFEDENRARPYRAVSNVEILDIDRVAYATPSCDFFSFYNMRTTSLV